MKCPFMVRTILLDKAKNTSVDVGTSVSSKYHLEDGKLSPDLYTNDNALFTNFDPTKNIDAYDVHSPSLGKHEHTYMLYPDCLQENCQLWDTDNTQCGMLVSNTIKKPSDEHDHLIQQLETVIGKGSERDANHSLVEYLIDIVGKNPDLLDTDHTLLKLIKHEHDSHYHGYRHECLTVPAGCGKPVGWGSGDMIPMGLIQEYLNNEDYDMNGLIWMNDFIFSNTDPNIPTMIKNILSGIDTEALGIETVFTWNQYLSTLSDDSDD